jgi:hypothetical protein
MYWLPLAVMLVVLAACGAQHQSCAPGRTAAMSYLTVWVYDDPYRANEAWAAVLRLTGEG